MPLTFEPESRARQSEATHITIFPVPGIRSTFSIPLQRPLQVHCLRLRRSNLGEHAHLKFLLHAVAQLPSPRVVNASGANLLTKREEHLVRLVSDAWEIAILHKN